MPLPGTPQWAHLLTAKMGFLVSQDRSMVSQPRPLLRVPVRSWFFIVVVSLCIARAPANGQSPSGLEIDEIEFEGNAHIGTDALLNAIESKESPGFFSRLFNKSDPESLSRKVFEEDFKRIEDLYNQEGYYNVRVSGSLLVDSAAGDVDLLFRIVENGRSFVDTVTYLGLEEIPAPLRTELHADPVLYVGMPYQRTKGEGEINRILDFLANHGYPLARFNYALSSAQRLLSTNNFHLTYVFDVGARYVFGDATVHIEPPRPDITNPLVLRQMDFAKGEPYSREKKISSERNLNRLDLFETARIENGTVPDTTSGGSIPVDIFITARPQHEISPEVIVSDDNNVFNIGLGAGYTNRNFFGDGRLFNIRARARTQSIDEIFAGKGFRSPDVNGAVELRFDLVQPYLFTRTLSGSWTASISAEKQSIFILSILRNKIGFSKQFAQFTYGLLDWTLERVNPEILDPSDTSNFVLSTLAEERQPQFNSILTATLQRDKTNDIFFPSRGFFNSISIEEAGILPKLFSGIRAGLPFTQYYKVTLFGRWYHDLTANRFNIVAWKLKAGYQDKYGESRYSGVRIPLNRRFFAGGSGSVRGWRPRELGAMSDDLVELGGNFVFEASAEMRVNHFRGLGTFLWLPMDRLWAVYFVDFGNVWGDIKDFKAKDIAIAAGFGIRYETFFGPFRIDYGMKMYDPKADPGRQSVFSKQFIGETLKSGVLHFGIGHAF
jgi:outer membrane protein insertion porin family